MSPEAAGALAAEGGDVALAARDKTVPEAAREAVSAASGRPPGRQVPTAPTTSTAATTA